MVVGVHGNMEAAQKHVVVDKRLEEERVQTHVQNMEEIPVQEVQLILRAVIFENAQVTYSITIRHMSESHVNL